jgi:NOL1/NOP2/sun family putative RNA methylase
MSYDIFNENFLEYLKELLGNELEIFLENSMKPLKESIRVNTLKISCDSLKNILIEKGWKIENIPWVDYGFWINYSTEDIGQTLEHSLGYYYIQGAMSMLPVEILDPKPGELILDLCAAPGSKTTQISQKMQNKGIIVANDINIKRIKALSSNIQKCFAINVIISMRDGRFFFKFFKNIFDKVLVDAPCSSTGIIRKSWKVAKKWNIKTIERLSKYQTQLLLSGFDCLKEGGILVYSTCSICPEENERCINNLLKLRNNAYLEEIKIKNVKYEKGITKWKNEEYDKDISKCIRIYPHYNDSEGFFIAKIVKKND